MAKSAFTVLLIFALCPSVLCQRRSQPADGSDRYVTAKDSNWYAKQVVPMQTELAEIDRQIRTLNQARKSGKGTTGAVDLDTEPEAVTADAQLLLLQQRRTQLLKTIADLEEEARKNDIAPGALRTAEEAAQQGKGDTKDDADVDTPEFVQTKDTLQEEQAHLERAQKEVDLLQRQLHLDTHTVYSNPEYIAQKSGKVHLTAEKNQLDAEQSEIRETQQRIAQLEEHLEDIRLHSANRTIHAEIAPANSEPKDETYWRKQFAEIHYKIRTAQSELDILQRELNEDLLIYDPNPQKAMRENVTRKDVNSHRQAIDDKKNEIGDLQKQQSDLEDDLRHAGGDPGWSRN
jgi:hypothetical protein